MKNNNPDYQKACWDVYRFIYEQADDALEQAREGKDKKQGHLLDAHGTWLDILAHHMRDRFIIEIPK